MNREDVIRLAREAGIEFHERKNHLRIGTDILFGDDSTEKLERFAALVAAAEREKRKEDEMMAECMDMVRQELIQAGVISKEVPPMMVAEAVMVAVRNAVAAEREECAKVCDEMAQHWQDYKDTALLNGDVELSNAASGEPRAAISLAKLIRSRCDL